MIGMEKMISQMLGISPEQMSEMVTGFQGLLTNLASRLEAIEAKQDAILRQLGSVTYGNAGSIGNGGGDASGGTGGGSGAAPGDDSGSVVG